MARARHPRKQSSASSIPEPPQPPALPPDLGAPAAEGGAETTGRYLVVYRDDVLDAPKEALQSLSRFAGYKHVASAADWEEGAMFAEEAATAEAVYFPALGIAVVPGDDARLQSLMAASADESSNVLAIEPEYVYHAIATMTQAPMEYLRGYRAAVEHIYEELVGEAEEREMGAEAAYQDTPQFTWGLQATRVPSGRFNGQGIRVAVLDTGLDLLHPDFRGRHVVSQSFIPGQTVQDGQSHGTHCTGTSCGPKSPPTGVRRYGCAFGADIHIGKVLSNSGSSVGSSVLAGMNWAVAKRCQVISMSLGANVNQVSVAFDQAGRRALAAGCLIVAAAGNNASRQAGNFGFVGQPANSPSIMAVGAIDNVLRVADFSARSSAVTGPGGKVDIAAPGVAVFSSVPVNRGRHAVFSGTSMATPHVAGIAALWSQATGHTGAALWTTLVQNTRRIPGDVRDVGGGLVQAPQ